jgi:hypothetical protein
MPGIARQFEPQITRSGGAPSKYRFVVRCSDCASTDAYEASKPTSNETVKGYFDERGWLLGRDRSYDLCPACLARPRRDGKSEDGRSRETADILARHLGKPEALAAKVFRPKEAAPPQPSPSRLWRLRHLRLVASAPGWSCRCAGRRRSARSGRTAAP